MLMISAGVRATGTAGTPTLPRNRPVRPRFHYKPVRTVESAMLSASECFHHAARCEEQAEDTGDLSLLEVAAKWRKLGNQEKGWKEARKTFPGTISGERALTPPPAAVRSAR